ncbi:pyruvate kinase [Clostridium zeae]|uniref:Pyruvate kinase n=1 Tax=Clostridium zeae TaxID=2759022 RepID=A0ABQ1E922_9CLOT|nr:pyruvate kinase [Clostridium zeae]GFZ31176.1 pyruvate kinase [Clostridium zeae]
MQKTKMIFTIGPASDNEEILKKFIEIGMSAARLNFSHGTHEDHKIKIDLIKKLRNELNSSTAILMDIKGPKIRTHNFANNEATLKEGNNFIFSCGGEILGDETKCSISYDVLYEDIKPGGTILVDDGLLEFRVDKVEGKDIICTVVVGGTMKNHKGVNVPNVNIKLPGITDKDKEDLKFGCEMGVDFVAASFVRKASDVAEIRSLLDDHGGADIRIISKIESQEGVDNIDSIIEVSDGIMVARGDMGVEIPIEKVPIIQKSIIRKCNEAGKIVITATQMLDSMIRNSRPTRAEACDICNAIFDGTDAIMLSGESASGNYPIEAASTMSRIAKETEANLDYGHLMRRLKEPSLSAFGDAISYSAAKTALKFPTKAIVAATQSGATARLLSKYRPSCPIVAITPNDSVRRHLSLNFGVIPKICREFSTTDEIINEAKNAAIEVGIATTGENIIVAAGMPTAHTGGTNMLKIEKL